MENNNNNQIIKETNDVPCCSKSLDDNMENDSSNVNLNSKQEQTATNYLAKLRSKKRIGYNYKQKYSKKINVQDLIKKFNLKQFSIKIQRLDPKYERSLLRKLYPNQCPEQKPTSIESSCAICLETLLEVNLIFLNLLNNYL